MFKKILIAEDIDSINFGNRSLFESQLECNIIEEVQYCDDAYLKIQKAIGEELPFELLITDLSFKKDYRKQKLNSGEELIEKVKEHQPNIKVITYSVEDRIAKVRRLFEELGIDGHVCKGRNGLRELMSCIQEVSEGNKFVSAEVKQALQANDVSEMDEYDIKLVKHLSKGMTQEQIGTVFKSEGIKPYSKSSIEKRINKLKIVFKAKNVIHLVAIIKDMGLI